jgi:chorismate mutase
MRLRTAVSCSLLVATALAVAPLETAAASGATAPATVVRTAVTLHPLADLAARRVLIADRVAAAKFGTSQPIDDPVRERQVLDLAASRAVELGIDPEATVRVFRDQIEASKIVQRGLFARWTAHPRQRPVRRPDLPTEVRPVIDELDAALLTQLRDTRAARAQPSCLPRLLVAAAVVDRRHHLDRLHEAALRRALASVCADAGASPHA